jgi:hypothetical protein
MEALAKASAMARTASWVLPGGLPGYVVVSSWASQLPSSSTRPLANERSQGASSSRSPPGLPATGVSFGERRLLHVLCKATTIATPEVTE